ncbi:MAG: hypothetical protein J0G29_05585 [Alphaproteobacteria bacterium]|nr:hypothetical protein [Alphaproteobacteria bacterium]OJV45117.1 MAG: hypothetical protein BGO28_05665 [Alphaproteobacteria bacterium 43-37]
MKKLSFALLSAFLSLVLMSQAQADGAPASVKDRMKAIEDRAKAAKAPHKLDGKAGPNSKIGKCVEEFEAKSEEEVTGFVTRYCMFDEGQKATHAAILQDPWLAEEASDNEKLARAKEISNRMRKLYAKVINAHKGRKEQCEAVVKHLGDGEANKAHRQKAMDDAKAQKAKLIEENLADARDGKLTEEKQALLLAEGVYVDESDEQNPLKPTKDKLFDLKNGFVPNPANPTAMEAFTMFVHHCRKAPASKLHHGVGKGKAED